MTFQPSIIMFVGKVKVHLSGAPLLLYQKAFGLLVCNASSLSIYSISDEDISVIALVASSESANLWLQTCPQITDLDIIVSSNTSAQSYKNTR
jgi:hypothetical protein